MSERILFPLILAFLIHLSSYSQQSQVTDFTLVDTEKDTFQLYNLLDQGNIVLLDFWTRWCLPCKYSITAMKRLWQDYGGENGCFYILGLNIEAKESEETVKKYKTDSNITYPLFSMAENNNQPASIFLQLAEKNAIPSFVLIMPDKTVYYKHTGWHTGKLENIIDSIIQTNSCPIVYTDVSELKHIQNFVVYPNPTSGPTTVTGQPQEGIRITVYNISGELVLNRELVGQIVDLSVLPGGMYMLHIDQDKTTIRKKIVKL